MGIILQLALIAMRMRARQSAGRLAATSGIVLLAMLFALFGFGGFAAAAWIALAHALNPAQAALIMGAAGFGVAAVLMLIARARARRRMMEAPSLSALPDLAAVLKQTMGTASPPALWAPLIGVALLGLLIGRGGKSG